MSFLNEHSCECVCVCMSISVGIVFAFCSIHTWLLVTGSALLWMFSLYLSLSLCVCLPVRLCVYCSYRMYAYTCTYYRVCIHGLVECCAGALNASCSENALTDAIAMAVFPWLILPSNSAIIVECMKWKLLRQNEENKNSLKMCEFFQLTGKKMHPPFFSPTFLDWHLSVFRLLRFARVLFVIRVHVYVCYLYLCTYIHLFCH